MNLTIEELIEKCTVKIKIPGIRNEYGTGFFIAPSVILTCAHVVREPEGTEIFFISHGSENHRSAKIMYHFPKEVDLAILQTTSYTTSFCVYIGNEIQPRDPCFAFGYTDAQQGHPEGDPVTLECEGLAGSHYRTIKLKGGQIRPGMSGSPLLNQKTGKVCGVINKSRSRQTILGGEASPIEIISKNFPPIIRLHDEFHQAYDDWRRLLVEDTEPFVSDWSYLNSSKEKWVSYIRALIFLISAFLKWLIWGLKAPRAFPLEAIGLLIKHTFSGDIGYEINRQRKDLTRKLEMEVDLAKGGQAKIINRLESQASILSELINILILDSQNLASSSRLFWAVELIYEQQDLLNNLKRIDGNSYPELERFKIRTNFLNTGSDRKRYRNTDRIISKILSQNSGLKLYSLSFFGLVLADISSLVIERPKIGVPIGEVILEFLNIIRLKKTDSTFSGSEDSNQEEDIVAIKSIFEELEANIQENPDLKVLSKVKILMENVAGKPIIGGPFRAWGKSRNNKYHFSRKCKLYPERARPHEMNKIICYDSHEKAQNNHEPCKNCITAENIKSADFIGDESS